MFFRGPIISSRISRHHFSVSRLIYTNCPLWLQGGIRLDPPRLGIGCKGSMGEHTINSRPSMWTCPNSTRPRVPRESLEIISVIPQLTLKFAVSMAVLLFFSTFVSGNLAASVYPPRMQRIARMSGTFLEWKQFYCAFFLPRSSIISQEQRRFLRC